MPTERESLTLLCLSHLGWDHVWQRPQQLMSRFTRHCRVIYVDPPAVVPGSGQPVLWEQEGAGGVRVVRPIFGAKYVLNDDETLDLPRYEQQWLKLLPQTLAEAGPRILLWVFSPLADYLVEAALPQVALAVYDCMDDLASFADGTREMREREDRLLGLVDLLFTGGRSMYEERRHRHPRAHCFPSGVDVEHYRQVRDPSMEEHPLVARIPHPRLGYFGVLDERIDWEMIAAVAEQRPTWQWVLVGPIVKVKRQDLPVAPNIHYLGKQQYADLPSFLKGFDIATMPFALNQATKFISPTKTLEYLAGGKQVISTSVPDVVKSYPEIVHIADGPDAWIAAVDQTLALPEEEAQARLAKANEILATSSWDSIAEQMWALIAEQMEEKAARQ